MSADTSMVSAVTAAFSAVVGPLLTIFAIKRQGSTAEKQIKATIISSNRQKWIDTLRDVLADFQAKSVQLRYLASKSENNEWHDSPLFADLISLRSRAVLLLNPNEADHQKLINLLYQRTEFAAYKSVDWKEELIVGSDINTLAQTILKKEWNRVKAGEPAESKSRGRWHWLRRSGNEPTSSD